MTGRPSITNAELLAPDKPGSVDIAPDARYRPVIEELMNRLHSELDFHQLMDTFVSEVRAVLECSGIEYSQRSNGLYYAGGVTGQHSSHYELRHAGEFLGEISFTRERAFHEHELVMIETMVGGLIRPLHNALKYQQAINFAQRDELTGLMNDSYYHNTIELEIKRAHRYKTPFSLLLIDLDDFRQINENYGRKTGDAVLIEIGERIKRATRGSDIIVRSNGDRFLVFMPNTSTVDASVVAERIRAFVVEESFACRTVEIDLTMSIGVVTVSAEDTRHTLTERVERVMCRAKTLGKNRVHIDTSADNLHERLLA